MYNTCLKQFFKDKSSVRKSLIEKFAKIHCEQYEVLVKQYQDYKQEFDFRTFLSLIIKDKLDSFCCHCGKQLNYNQIRNNCKYCSVKCSANDQQVRNKYKQTCVEKYGVQSPSQNQLVSKKTKNTNLEKYGVEHPLQNEQIKRKVKNTNLQRYGYQYGLQNENVKLKKIQTNLQKYGYQYGLQNQQVKQKQKQTNLQKYGVENVFQNQKIKEKIKQTNLEKYGVESVMQSDIFCNKSKQTNLQKYGVEFPTQSQQIKQKIKDTNLEKYGVENVFQNQKIKEKIKQTNLQKYGVEHILQSQLFRQKIQRKNLDSGYETMFLKCFPYVKPLFNKQDYYGGQNDIVYCWECKQCGNVFKQRIYITSHLGFVSYIPRCLKCYPYISGFSELEKQFTQFLKQNTDLKFLQHNRNIIKPYQLDIYIPQKSVAIQFNGLYWHSDDVKLNDYHLMKTQKCLEKNIQLIHVFQDQWLYKQEIVKDRINNILGIYNNRVFARKCIIKQIPSNICNQFLQINHIQGRDHSKIRLGLFYNEELISVMTFGKPRFNKNYEYQLIRFASKLNTKVIGGASKLLKYFERKYNPKSIISYADRRYSNGKLYYALGFQFLNNSEPNYFWCKNQIKFSRYQTQKHKLKKLLGQNFNDQLTEDQNMYLNGYNKIYDCGNMVFVKEY